MGFQSTYDQRLSPYKAKEKMMNRDRISKALWQCLIENDVDGFKEILRTHLQLANKEDFANNIEYVVIKNGQRVNSKILKYLNSLMEIKK